jgi:hypothetical protein
MARVEFHTYSLFNRLECATNSKIQWTDRCILLLSTSASDYVRKFLVVEGLPCGRHCSEPTRFLPLVEDGDRLVGAYLCPSNFVSRVVYFSVNPDGKWFEKFLRDDRGGGDRIRSKDVRKATRHGLELGREAESRATDLFPQGIVEYYWTFYPGSDEEKKNGNFLCDKCNKFFVKSNSSPDRICPRHKAA